MASLSCSPRGQAIQYLREGGLSDAEIDTIANISDIRVDPLNLIAAIIHTKCQREQRMKILVGLGYTAKSSEDIAKLFGGEVTIEWLDAINFHVKKNKESKNVILVFVVSLLFLLLFLFLPMPEILGGVLALASLAASIRGIFLMHENRTKKEIITSYSYEVIQRYLSQQAESSKIETH